MATNKEQEKFYVLYHAECFDGRMAAWAVYDFFFASSPDLNRRNPKEEGNVVQTPDIWMQFVPMSYDDPMPDIENATVFIVDFSTDVDKLIALSDKSNQIYILDHHETMRDKFLEFHKSNKDFGSLQDLNWKEDKIIQFSWVTPKGNIVAHFDNNSSGAMLTWKFFNKKPTDIFEEADEAPSLLKYAQDFDLFKWKYRGSREIATAVYDVLGDTNQGALDFLVRQMGHFDMSQGPEANEYAKTLFDRGAIIFAHQTTLAKGIIKRGVNMVKYNGDLIPMCAAPRELRTLVGELLAKDHPFSVIYEDYPDRNIREYSFRSNKHSPTATNVKEFAQSLGGGGHIHAAGVRLPIHPYMFLLQAITETSEANS